MRNALVTILVMASAACAVEDPRCEEACAKLWGMDQDSCAADWNFPIQPSTPSTAEDCTAWCAAGLEDSPCPDDNEFCGADVAPEDIEDFLGCALEHSCDEIVTGLDTLEGAEVLDDCALGFPDAFGF